MGRKFVKGQSGNPAGRPKGIPDKRKLLSDVLSSADEAAIRKVVIGLAKGGDLNACKLIWERIYPVRSATEEELLRQIEELESRVARLSKFEAAG